MKERLIRTIVFSRHPTHNILRKDLPSLPFRTVVRLGSTTDISERLRSKGQFIECNSIQGIKNTSNKIEMKIKFNEAEINSPQWYLPNIEKSPDFNIKCSTTELLIPGKKYLRYGEALCTEKISINSLQFPLIAKINFHSRGRGMLKIDSAEQLIEILKNPEQARKYTFERYANFVQEYRVHATAEGIFYICRKLRKEEATDRWFFNSKNSIFQITYEDGNWIKEKIACFKEMEQHCIKALKALEIDIAGFDIRVNANGEKFFIIEANSACSFGEHTAQHYLKQIPLVLKKKYENFKTEPEYK